jgi:acetylornithine deacetylase/succinyl-diaminopimelate desuccinylase-like protein
MGHFQDIRGWLNEQVGQKEFRKLLGALLGEMCSVRTIPSEDLAATKEREGEVFALISRAVEEHVPAGRFTPAPISRRISEHPAYSFPYYAGSPAAYEGRHNLLFFWDTPERIASAPGIAVNAHIDTVAPYLEVYTEEQTVHGRGACDDKSGCVIMVGALYLLEQIRKRFAVVPGSDLTFMFVIDEEMGGNGSLSLVLDRELRSRYRTLMILECCDSQIHPANRGAVWYQVSIPRGSVPQPIVLAMEIVRELEIEGATIKAESNHPLFPDKPVQQSQGVLGPYGEHPSRICAAVELEVGTETGLNRFTKSVEQGLAAYVSRYGDKGQVLDPESGKPKVERHYSIEPIVDGYRLAIWGCSGHMAAILENDNACTKAAFLVEQILRIDPEADIRFPGGELPDPLLLEGGQGFLPTHTLQEVEQRIETAVQRACRTYADGSTIQSVTVGFDKLHNDAFDGDPDSRAVRDALLAADSVGIEVRRPVVGWTASCDARLFAREYPDLTVITSGPGALRYAHSDNEQISLEELVRSSAMLALFLLVHSGAVSAPSDGRRRTPRTD